MMTPLKSQLCAMTELSRPPLLSHTRTCLDRSGTEAFWKVLVVVGRSDPHGTPERGARTLSYTTLAVAGASSLRLTSNLYPSLLGPFQNPSIVSIKMEVRMGGLQKTQFSEFTVKC